MNYVFESIINFLEAVLMAQFFVRYFDSRVGYGSRTKRNIFAMVILTLVHFVSISLFNYFQYYSGYQQWIIDLLWFVAVVLILQGNVFEKLLLTQMSSIITSTIGVIFMALFGRWIEFDLNGFPIFGINRIILCLAAKIVYLIVTELLIRYQIEEKQYITNKTYIKLNIVMFATLIAYNFLLDIVYINILNDAMIREVYFVLIAMVAIDIIIYMLFLELTNNSIRLLKEQMKNAAYESEKKEIESIQEIHTQTMKIRHDMKNLLLLIRLKLQEGRVEEAKQYLENELNVKLAKINLVSTGNRLADSVINSHVEQAQERNISMQVMVECALDEADEMDLAILLSNLLDNAIEAAVLCDGPFVNIKIARKETYLHIMVSNSCKGVPHKEDGRLLTTKKDKAQHGYGISNVKDIVERYQGFYNYELEDGKFTTDILLHM